MENGSISYCNDLIAYIIKHANSSIAVHDRDMNYLFVSNKYIEEYDLFGKDAKGLYLLDAELASRMYTPPTLVL